MTVNPRKIINSPFGLSIANLIGKYTPYSLGIRVALFAADRISARKSWKLVRAARCNQWMAHRTELDKASLDKLVVDNFRNVALSIFDYYRYINDPAKSLRLIEPDPIAVQFVQRKEFEDRGVIIAGIHMSNFEMAFQLGGLAGIKALSLIIAELNSAYKKQWDLLRKGGLKAVPTSMGSIKQAIEYLRAGGIVITAIDRPDPKSSYRPNFFGHPASLPVHHTFMALKAHVPIVVTAIMRQANGKYKFLFSDPIEMQPHPDRHSETLLNTENVLHVAEDFILHDSSQWAMTFPVWPEEMDRVPE